MHNDDGRGNAGGVFQAAGLKLVMDEMTTVLASLGMMVSKFFKFEDLFEELQRSPCGIAEEK
jgi:hypothetical protein